MINNYPFNPLLVNTTVAHSRNFESHKVDLFVTDSSKANSHLATQYISIFYGA